MKVLFYLDSLTYFRGMSGGVRRYVEATKRVLEDSGYNCAYNFEVTLSELESFDVVHIFSSFYPNERFFEIARRYRPVVCSPIYDPVLSKLFLIRLNTFMHRFPGVYTNHGARKNILQNSDYVLTMSDYEKRCLKRDYNIDFTSENLLFPTDLPNIVGRELSLEKSRDLIFIGDSGNSRQNILRLISAISGTGITLTLVGKCDCDLVLRAIDGNPNIQYLGFVSEERKYEELRKHKTYIMPALTSGFGISCIEAAQMGLTVIYTKYGGASQYLNSNAFSVDPYDEVDLRQKCLQSLGVKQENCLKVISAGQVFDLVSNAYSNAINNFKCHNH